MGLLLGNCALALLTVTAETCQATVVPPGSTICRVNVAYANLNIYRGEAPAWLGVLALAPRKTWDQIDILVQMAPTGTQQPQVTRRGGPWL